MESDVLHELHLDLQFIYPCETLIEDREDYTSNLMLTFQVSFCNLLVVIEQFV